MNKMVKNLAITAAFASISGFVIYKIIKDRNVEEKDNNISSDNSLSSWNKEICSSRHYKKLKIGK